jgi:MFS family permease
MTPFKRTFFSLYAAIFISSLGLGILSPILPAYVDRFAASSFILGVVFGSYSAARTLFMPPVGRLSDRFGRRPFILTGLLLFTIVSPLYSLATTAWHLMMVRFLQGIAAAMIMPVAMSAIGDLSPKGREGFIMGSFTSAFFAGLGFGPLIGGYLRDRYTMNAAFYGMGVLSLMALLLALATLPEIRPAKKEGPTAQAGDDQAGDEKKTGKSFMSDNPLLGLLLFRFTRAIGIGLVWVIMPLYAIRDLQITAFKVGILLSVNTFITTLIQSPIGHLSDKFGHRKSLVLGSLVAAAATVSIAWTQDFYALVVISVALGLSGALIVPAGSALAVSVGRTRGMGRVMGLYNASLSLGTMVGPAFGGGILDLAGIKVVFGGGAILGLGGLIALLIMFPASTEGENQSKDLSPSTFA